MDAKKDSKSLGIRWLGVVFIALGLILSISPCTYGAGPQSVVEVTVPDYKVSTVANLDYVDIPGGNILLVDGKPRVPYYSSSVDYPKGYRVQDVTLAERAGLVTATGLKLPTVVMEPLSSPSSESPAANEGWYPEEDYDWKVRDNPDGSTQLVIIMYPFYYNADTTEVKFYKDYRFNIEYVVSSVAITGLAPAEDNYQPGDKVSIDIRLNNSGEAQDIVVSTVITQYGSGEIVSGLPLRSIKNLAGDASLTVDWETNGVEAGYYCAEVTLTNTAGNVLGNKRVGFPLQVSETLEKPKGPSKFPMLYLIIGAVVVVGVVAAVLIIRLTKKVTKPRKKA
jgi:hypothetical protein